MVDVARPIPFAAASRTESTAELPRSNQRVLEACVAHLNDPAVILEVHDELPARVVFVNDAFVRNTGFSREEAVGRPPYLLIGPETQMAAVARLEAALRDGRSHREELIGYTKAGQPMWLEVDVAPVPDASGRIRHWISIERNVTARRQNEELLRSSEEHYRVLFEHNPLPMWVYDRETLRFRAVNDAAIAHYGYSREQFLAMSILDIRPREDVPALYGALPVEAIVFGQRGVWRHVTADGRLIRVDVSTHPVMFDGRAARMVLAHDVTSQLAAEEALRASEERFRLMARATNDAIWDLDLATGALWWGDGLTTLFGFDRDDTRDFAWWSQCIHPEDQPRVVESFEAALASGADSWSAEYRFLCKNGTYADVIDRALLLRTDDGTAVRAIGGVQDITQRKRQQDKLREQATLLLRAQRLESIGTLAGGIAHDINNVLQPILIAAGLLRDQGGNRACDELTTIEACALRGADMVKQLLAFARGGDVQHAPLLLQRIGGELHNFIRDTFPKSIELDLHIAADLSSVQANATQMHQLLLNLCVNARDAMPSGGKLSVGAHNIELDEVAAQMFPEAKPGRYVVLEVEDTGTGMPPELVERIFDPFFTTKPVGKGTGLGLFTAHAIARSHGGFIRVTTALGHGSKFRVYLPAHVPHVETDLRDQTQPIPHGTSELVLVVDDEETIRRMISRILDRHGYRVLLASSGTEAVAQFEHHRHAISAVVLDMSMPGMDGTATTAALKRIDPHVKLIGASGLPSPEFIAGVSQFVAKPFTPGTLLRALMEVLPPRE